MAVDFEKAKREGYKNTLRNMVLGRMEAGTRIIDQTRTCGITSETAKDAASRVVAIFQEVLEIAEEMDRVKNVEGVGF